MNQIRLPTKLVLSASCVASSWLSPVVRVAQPNQEKKMTNESWLDLIILFNGEEGENEVSFQCTKKKDKEERNY